MTTARDIIQSALRKIAVLGVGSSLSGEEAADALDALNALIASWSTQGSMIYIETAETFNLTANDGTYSMGPSGDFNTSRPLSIQAVTVDVTGDDYKLKNIDQREYAAIGNKIEQGDPCYYYHNGGYPLDTIRLWPIPSTNGTITIWSEKALTEFTDLNTTFALPPEYKRALIYNLAIELAPEYEKEPSNTVWRIANQSRKFVTNQNRKNDEFVSTLNTPSGNGWCSGVSDSDSSGSGGGSTGDYVFVGADQVFVDTDAVII